MEKGRKGFCSAGVVVLLAFALNTVAADESIVGVLYKDWTFEECKSSFPFPVTNDKNALNIEDAFISGKGRLLKGGVMTGCYCADDYVLDMSKTRCVKCDLAANDRNAVYYTKDTAETAAVIKVDGQDIGCRCAKKEGNKDYVGFDSSGKCKYEDQAAKNAACQATYGTTGVKACTGTGGTLIGDATFQGATIGCCCESGYGVEDDATNPGRKKCVKGAGGASEDVLCTDRGKAMGKGDKLAMCPNTLVPTFLGGTYDSSKATDDEKLLFESKYIGPMGLKPDGSQLYCCCGDGYIKSGGKCVKEVDECGEIVPGSVKQGRVDAGTVLVGTAYGAKEWQKDKMDAIRKKSLTCNCKTGYLPADRVTNPNGESIYVLDTCILADTCDKAVLGAVDSNDERAKNGTKITAGSWESSVLETIKLRKLDCSCPEGTIPFDANKAGGYDVCAIKDPDCLESDDLSALLYVGICGARQKGGEYPISFSRPVVFAGNQDVVAQDYDRNGVAKTAWAIEYGLTRAVGARDLYYLVSGRTFSTCEKPAEDAPFYEHVGYLKCLAWYPCDQMPLEDLGIGSSVAKAAYGGFLANRFYVYDRAQMEKDLMDLVKKISGIGGEISQFGTRVGASSSTYLGRISSIQNSIKSQNALLGSATTKAARDAISLKISELQTSLQKEFSDIRAMTATDKVDLATKTKKLAEMQTGIGKVESELSRYGIDFSPAGAPRTGPTRLGDALLDSLRAQARHAQDVITHSTKLVDAIDGAGTPGALVTRLKRESAALTGAVSSARSILAEAPKAETAVGKIMSDTRITAKIGASRLGKLIKRIPGASKLSNAGKWIAKTPIARGASTLAKGVGKYALGPALWAYGIADAGASAITYGISKEAVINPGERVISKTSIATPFTIKARDANIASAIDTMIFSSSGRWLGNSWLDGGLIDASGEASVTKPPGGIWGYTYKCEGGCQCNGNLMGNCVCYPISNEVNVIQNRPGRPEAA